MTHKWLISFLFVFVLSLSVHAAHELNAEEDVICEVCLHGKSQDDVLPVANATFDQQILRANQVNQLWINAFVDATHASADPIRGPPHFS
ncbi:hypothetical protein [Marinicella meishanensis]|uniref:hypothetical protein n=1 Tax=Marinicella meishanensis TaxID=2873263 RepID=UPI001CBF120F|nr:hypothetical protein [Marinicella sp. NBU2979]